MFAIIAAVRFFFPLSPMVRLGKLEISECLYAHAHCCVLAIKLSESERKRQQSIILKFVTRKQKLNVQTFFFEYTQPAIY